jgi:hypothetical protein
MRRGNTGSTERRVQKNKHKIGRKRVPTLLADLQIAQRTRDRKSNRRAFVFQSALC